MTHHATTIRAATANDDSALRRLAALDGRAPLTGHALLAEHEGVAIAGIALTSGAVVADPFAPTAPAVEGLRRRRYQLLRQGGDAGRVRPLLRRLAPQRAA